MVYVADGRKVETDYWRNEQYRFARLTFPSSDISRYESGLRHFETQNTAQITTTIYKEFLFYPGTHFFGQFLFFCPTTFFLL